MTDLGPPADIRPTREITNVRGFGGFLQLSRTEIRGESGPTKIDRHLLEVGAWSLRHKFRKVELPLSGGFGAIAQRRVASSFTFAANLVWDVTALAQSRTAENVFLGKAFLEDLFIGGSSNTNRFTVSALFALGDPFQYDIAFPGAEQADRNAFYYCDSVHLDEVLVVTSTEPPDLVRMEATGSGSAPLRRYAGPVWKGAGGFDFSQTQQGHDQPIA